MERTFVVVLPADAVPLVSTHTLVVSMSFRGIVGDVGRVFGAPRSSSGVEGVLGTSRRSGGTREVPGSLTAATTL